MRRRGDSGSRLKLVAVLAVFAALLVTGVALAASATIVGQADNRFNAASYSIDQGDTSTLQIAGGTHNVTANQTGPDGKALFRSSTISSGGTPVQGTEYLTTGNYPFICTVHPTTMQGTLTVSASGTPKPRPEIDLNLQSRKLEKVAKKGKLLVGITSNAVAAGVTLEAKLGKTVLGSATSTSLVAGQQTKVLKLGRRARAKLAGREKATVLLNGSVPFGAPDIAKGKLR